MVPLSVLLRARLVEQWFKHYQPGHAGDALGATLYARRRLKDEEAQVQLNQSIAFGKIFT